MLQFSHMFLPLQGARPASAKEAQLPSMVGMHLNSAVATMKRRSLGEAAKSSFKRASSLTSG